MIPKCKYCDGATPNFCPTVDWWHGVGPGGLLAAWIHVEKQGYAEVMCEDQNYWDKRDDEIDAQS